MSPIPDRVTPAERLRPREGRSRLLTGPFHFKNWIDEHRDQLKPPVGNQLVWKEREFIIMVVGGPNARKDFHINHGEEFFYQLEGDITLRVQDDNKVKDVKIREGEIYLLPGDVPHSPQRPAGTVGLVIERRRHEGEEDAFAWFCENCNRELYRESLLLKDIVKQLPPVFDGFYADAQKTTCRNCGLKQER